MSSALSLHCQLHFHCHCSAVHCNDSTLGNMGQGSRAILFDALQCFNIKGHTGEESERGIEVIRC